MERTLASEKEGECPQENPISELANIMVRFRYECEKCRALDTPMDKATSEAYRKARWDDWNENEAKLIMGAHCEAVKQNPAPATIKRIAEAWHFDGKKIMTILRDAMLQNPEETRKLIQGYQDLLSQLGDSWRQINYLLARTPEEIREEMRKEAIANIRASVKEHIGRVAPAEEEGQHSRDARWLAEFALLPSVRLIKDIRDRDGDK